MRGACTIGRPKRAKFHRTPRLRAGLFFDLNVVPVLAVSGSSFRRKSCQKGDCLLMKSRHTSRNSHTKLPGRLDGFKTLSLSAVAHVQIMPSLSLAMAVKLPFPMPVQTTTQTKPGSRLWTINVFALNINAGIVLPQIRGTGLIMKHIPIDVARSTVFSDPIVQ